jgi:transposase-like protein
LLTHPTLDLLHQLGLNGRNYRVTRTRPDIRSRAVGQIWKPIDNAGGRGDGLTTAEREELNRLRRENRQLKLERDILSKAAAWFARGTNTIPPKGSGS